MESRCVSFARCSLIVSMSTRASCGWTRSGITCATRPAPPSATPDELNCTYWSVRSFGRRSAGQSAARAAAASRREASARSAGLQSAIFCEVRSRAQGARHHIARTGGNKIRS
eukprot:858186-Prymnesium_polylepis.2